ncbi:MAG: CAP domain-containing protein [Xanthobacteraceae bacterium]
MTGCRFLASHAARLVGMLALALVAGCAADRDPPSEPTFYRSLAEAGGQLDAATAASMISGYRSNNGLTPVTVDPELMKLADAQARAMASRDKLDHNVIRGFNERLRAQGYQAKTAVENISAGYHTLAEAFSGWRDSPPHRANMLLNGATRMGIAAVYAPKSKYKVFWALILAAPDERRG